MSSLASVATPDVVAPTNQTVWNFDPSHSELGFAVRHLMISTVRGRFSGFKGTVALDGDDFSTATVDVTIDATTVDTREPKRDAHLRSADFFDAARFPTLTFKSRRVENIGDGEFTLIGDLTIRGVSREVSLAVTAEGTQRDPWGNERAGFGARGTIKRSAFGLEWNQALETGGVLVGDDVKLVIEAQLIRHA
ncbi:MAG: YceI family protein [Acidobacteriota bacterium]